MSTTGGSRARPTCRRTGMRRREPRSRAIDPERAGLLATQGIRGGANRQVLERIKQSGGIFFARSDEPWVLSGAAVHISFVGQDDGSEKDRELDGQPVTSINPNLTTGLDLSRARLLLGEPRHRLHGRHERRPIRHRPPSRGRPTWPTEPRWPIELRRRATLAERPRHHESARQRPGLLTSGSTTPQREAALLRGPHLSTFEEP